MRRLPLLAVVLGAVACMRPVAPPPKRIATVAVLPPHNRTGDPLLVSGTSFLERYALASDRVTVPDVLAVALRAELVRRGFSVVAPEAVQAATATRQPGSPEAAVEIARKGRLDDSILYTEITRWEPDGGTHPSFVIVAARATLLDPSTGAVLWEQKRPAAPIATTGAVTPGSASAIAAEKVAGELLAAWSR